MAALGLDSAFSQRWFGPHFVNQGDVQGGFAIGGFMLAFLGFAGGVMAHMNGENEL